MSSKKGTDFECIATEAVGKLKVYLQESAMGDTPVVNLETKEALSEILNLPSLIRDGGLSTAGFSDFLTNYLKYSMHMHHPHYMGHQVAIPHIGSMMGDLIHGVIANPMSIYEMGPSAATVEIEMTRWMLERIGWSESGSGVFTHGGSLANIHALLSAREAIEPDAWVDGNPDDLVVLAPDAAHYSIARAVSIIGLGTSGIVKIPTDAHDLIIPGELNRLIERVRSDGKRIMAVVANACATSNGLHDPIEEIADITRREKIWFHVDSPHGATALLSKKYHYFLKGIEKADSMVWDAHKMMQTGSLCTALLFRDKRKMEKTFRQNASYLFHEKDNPGFDIIPYQIECTKSGLATKLFLVMASIGEKGMERYIDTVYDLARDFQNMVKKRSAFVSPFVVESNIVCFQYRPDVLNQLQLRERLVKLGIYYITYTRIKGSHFLRIVIMNTESDHSILAGLLDHIEEIGKEMLNET